MPATETTHPTAARIPIRIPEMVSAERSLRRLKLRRISMSICLPVCLMSSQDLRRVSREGFSALGPGRAEAVSFVCQPTRTAIAPELARSRIVVVPPLPNTPVAASLEPASVVEFPCSGWMRIAPWSVATS